MGGGQSSIHVVISMGNQLLAACFGIAMWSSHMHLCIQNMTTNEQINAGRFPHFRHPVTGAFFNPFDIGTVENVKQYFRSQAGEDMMRSPPRVAGESVTAPLLNGSAPNDGAKMSVDEIDI